MSKLNATLLSVLFVLTGTAARASTISFDGVIAPGALSSLSSKVIGDYSFTSNYGTFIVGPDFFATSANTAENGTTYLYADKSTTTITSTDAAAFSVNSIDLTNFRSNESATATFIGRRADGTTLSSSYTLANIITTDKNVFVTETLAGFDNLTSFQIVASVAAVNIDNIVIDAPVAPARVPEPASLAILGLGLGGIAAVRRRKSS